MEARRKVEDYRAGVVAATTANVMGGKKKNGQGWDASDFFDLGEKERQEQSEDEMKATARMITALFGGGVQHGDA